MTNEYMFSDEESKYWINRLAKTEPFAKTCNALQSAQSFVDSLNHKTMPKMGYKFIDGKWKWPVYDWDNHDYADFESKDHVESQYKRLGRYKFKE